MRHGREVLEALQFTIGIDPHSARRVAEERGGRGDVQLTILTSGRGWLRVAVVAGAPRRGSILFLPGRGLFEVTRRDEWRVGDAGARVFLMLRTTFEEAPRAAAEPMR